MPHRKLPRCALVVALVLVVPAVSSGILAEEEAPVEWYSGRMASDPPGKLFTNDLAEAATAIAPALSLAPGATWNEKPYIPPKWAAGKPNAGTWGTTGAIAAGWAYLWVDGDRNDDAETIKEVGDYTQIFTAAAGLGMTIGAKDKQGLIQYGISFGVSMASVQLFKHTADRWRPDGTDTLSFPSGHTAGSFFGAGYIYQRYGPKWGIPALVMASYTGFSRIYGQKHFAGDTLSGASIAMLSTLAFVKPADPERAAHDADLERHRKWRFEFEIYNSDVSKNEVTVPKDTGTLLDFRFDQKSNPTINGAAALDWNVKDRHNVRFRYTPFEQRDTGSVEAGTVFGDYTFGDADVASIYFAGDLRARYAYDLIPESKFFVQLGGGLTLQQGEMTLREADLSGDAPEIDEATGDQISGLGVAPIVYIRAGYGFTKKFILYLEGDAFVVSSAGGHDTVLKFNYRINPKWDVAAGYRASAYELDFSELKNSFDVGGFAAHAAYSF